MALGKRLVEDYETYKKNLTEDVTRLEDCFKDKCGFTTNIFALRLGSIPQKAVRFFPAWDLRLF